MNEVIRRSTRARLTTIEVSSNLLACWLKDRRPDCPYVFHRNGKQIKSFRRAFKSACKDTGLAGVVPHDMRRSAVRNIRKAGVGETDGMKISGHRTNSVYKRYDIIDEQDQGAPWSASKSIRRVRWRSGKSCR